MTKDELDESRRKTVVEEKKKGMMDLLMEVKNENGEILVDEHIIDLLWQILFSGHETVAHTAMWATIYLHHHPEILQKAKVRLELVFGVHKYKRIENDFTSYHFRTVECRFQLNLDFHLPFRKSNRRT